MIIILFILLRVNSTESHTRKEERQFHDSYKMINIRIRISPSSKTETIVSITQLFLSLMNVSVHCSVDKAVSSLEIIEKSISLHSSFSKH